MEFPMRINKYLAHTGYATRKGADALIESGKVFVNGTRATLGMQISEHDAVEVRGAPTTHFRYLLYYKPRGIVTHSPEAEETDILTRIARDHNVAGVFPVGRLDKDSEGLIILTNDGRITERLLSPNTNHEKEYEVTVDKRVTGYFLKRLSHGVDIEGYVTKSATARLNPKNECSFFIALTEGKKHQVRRMCAALGYQVKTLKRIRIMNLYLRPLRAGAFRELNDRERKIFLGTLGLPV